MRPSSRTKFAAPATIALLVLMLTAGQCSGTANMPPVADAGLDQSVAVGVSVSLDGTASSDPDGDRLTYSWTFESIPAGSSSALTNPATATPSFPADVAGLYMVTLVVSDGEDSAVDQVGIVAGDEPPVISPTGDQVVSQGESIDVPFTITDELVESTNVGASAVDTSLVPGSGLEVLGSGGDRTLRVTPDPAGWGSTTVTLTAEDPGGNVGTEAFLLTVRQLFAAPHEKLAAPDAADFDNFGYSVSIDGDFAIIGAPRDDDDGSDSGSAYVFRRDSDGWTLHAKFPPDPPVVETASVAAGDGFGSSVALSGVYAVVGAPNDDERGTNAGAAYIYERCVPTFTFCSQSWFEIAKLTSSDAASEDLFGTSVAISGDYAIVGASFNDLAGFGTGSAYVFKRNGDTWIETTRLTASDAARYDFFGTSVAIDGDYILVGAPRVDYPEGFAYVFKRSGDAWIENTKLIASDAFDTVGVNSFGSSVAISGDYAVIGSRWDDLLGSNEGSSYIFERSGDIWSETVKLVASDAADFDNFGSSVAIDGDYAIIGAPIDDVDGNGEGEGSAYVFKRAGDAWSQTVKLTASDAADYDRFGASVAISGDHAIIGAWGDNLTGRSQGSAYSFQK